MDRHLMCAGPESIGQRTAPCRSGRRVLMRRSVGVIGFAALICGVLTGCIFGGAAGQRGMGCSPATNIAADNATHSIYRNDLVSESSSAATFARDEITSATQVTAQFSTSLGSLTDVDLMDAAYTTYCGYTWVSSTHGGVAGLTTCNSLNSANECEQHEVRLSRLVSEGDTTTHVRNMVTHELGHSLGLNHHGGGLMSGSGINNSTHFGSDDIKAVNGYF